ncbi:MULTISPECIES: hypothetical protein [unclassified Aquitalea]|uniref:hypothetical protein n=1 Tax=unclassified Aquitalea TaxID=2628611 RepID=UPI0015BAD8C9|nr:MULTISPECIES: hypothetical protein [unclassified Aquitalea]NWK76512.1 hypothetical protein [Aquitalea sp. LB_tupeE]
MPLMFEGHSARLVGQVGVEDAETLLVWLADQEAATVDLEDCEHIHAAVFQALLVSRIVHFKPPRDGFMAGYVFPLLQRERSEA